MKIVKNALPWFPLTPEYIDLYFDGVLKYLRDEVENSSDDTLSFQTTIDLLGQRAEDYYQDYSRKSIVDLDVVSEPDLIRAIRVVAADVYFKFKDSPSLSLRRVILLAFLVTKGLPELAERMSVLILSCLNGEGLRELTFALGDIINFQLEVFSQKLLNLSVVERQEPSWFEGHGAIKVFRGELFIFAQNRVLQEKWEKLGGKTRQEPCVPGFPIYAMVDKKDKRAFSLEHFMSDLKAFQPYEGDVVRLKQYSEDDKLTVRVLNKSYDSVTVETIDPAYESIRGDLIISKGDNVRGIYLTDIARSVTFGDRINVRFREGGFDVYDTILDFIHEKFWMDDSSVNREKGLRARLLFPKTDFRANTWCTDAGFLVRTGFENITRGETRVLSITGYDAARDWIMAKVLNSDTEEFTIAEENESKKGFVQFLLYSTEDILEPFPLRKIVNMIVPDDISMFHRTLAMKERFFKSWERASFYAGCRMLSFIAENSSDSDYYHIKEDYGRILIQFAMNQIGEIKELNCRGIESHDVIEMDTMVDILSEYGKKEESEFLNESIRYNDGVQLSAVAKLVQAANRFQGSTFLNRLRTDLHREICFLLDVSDAIVENEKEVDNSFPFEPEGPFVEHKMSWVYDNDKTSEINETAQSAKILKTVCAFLNESNEDAVGHLYIGTDEKRKVISGIQRDIEVFVNLGEFDPAKDLNDQYLSRIAAVLRRCFPDCSNHIRPLLICDGQVLDICVYPSESGVVYYHDIPYERFGSSSRVMSPEVKERILNKKFIQYSDLAQKIETIRKAIYRQSYVILRDYYSSNSNTERDRKLEVFGFTDEVRRDAVWAYDSSDRKNKVFLLKRAGSVELLNERWKNEKRHQKEVLDIMGFFGKESIPLDITINSIRAKNIFVESYPNAKSALKQIPGERKWQVTATLLNHSSLDAVCSFYLGYSEEVDISKTPELVILVSKRVEKLLERVE